MSLPVPGGATGSKTPQQPGHEIVATTAVELIGVALLAILAGVNDQLGSVIVVLMWGFLIGWLLLHSDQLGRWFSKL